MWKYQILHVNQTSFRMKGFAPAKGNWAVGYLTGLLVEAKQTGKINVVPRIQGFLTKNKFNFVFRTFQSAYL